MLLKNKKREEKLKSKIDKLINILEKNNFREITYILGNKKEIIVRNILAGIFRGVGIGVRCNFSYGNNYIYIEKNSRFKYSNYRRVYCRCCRNCRT